MRNKSKILIFSGFIFLGAIVTYPLIFKMSSHIYGVPGDSLVNIYWFWWWKYAWGNNLSFTTIPLLSAPFGVKILDPFLFWTLYSSLLAIGLTFLANEVFAYNFLILSSFPLAAITMYFLVYHFTRNRLASMVSGIIYSFSPYHFWHGFQHLTVAQIQWMPLYALFLFKLSEARNYKNAILCGFLFSVVTLETLYYGYFMLIFTGAFILWQGWQGLRKKSKVQSPKSKVNYTTHFHTCKVILVAVLVALVIILPFTYNIFKIALASSPGESIAEGGLSRPFEDLFMYSAQPLHYLIPSGDNPFLGRLTRNFIKIYHPIEQTLYLGWVGIILSIIAIRGWRRKNRKQRAESREQREKAIKQSSNQAIEWSSIQDQGSRIQKATSFFLFAGIVALLFSFAPYLELGNFRIFFPSYFMYKVIPMVRVLARFGIVVLLSVSVLAGIALTSILQRISTPKKKGIFLTFIMLLVFFEFTNIPPFRTTDVSIVPPVYKWLAKQPGDFIIAEYPLETDSRYLFYQRIHQKRLINGAPPGSQADRICQEIKNILDLKTPGILRHLGAKYVIFHSGKYAKSSEVEIIGQVPDIKKQPGLKLVKTFPETKVYEVIALPIKPLD
ncbi:MAG TPA: hypothetical protein ENH97_01080 [bacterium]|nr:hypothetical protein [bacterium]